jgi:GT2 family glycosyltransferase
MLSDQIGVVVIGRNEGMRLVDCLLSLKSKPYKIVYVDSGSTDGSILAASGLGAFVVSLDQALPFTAARARNEGFAAFKRLSLDVRFVQFVDGDCEVESGWFETAATFMEEHQDVAIVCGRRRELFPDRSIYNMLCDIEWNTTCGESPSCGGDSMVRAAAFDRVGGFRPELVAGEEPELCARLREIGWKIWRIDAAMTRHDVNLLKLSQWWRRMVRSGYGFAEISRLTCNAPFWIYRRETNRAVFWGGLLPAALIGAALIHHFALAAALIYPAQVIRVAWRRGPGLVNSWSYAGFMLIGKFAEFQGVSKFYWALVSGRASRQIDYKTGGS